MLFYHYLNEIRPVILQTNKTQSNIFILSGAGKRIFPGIINRMINEGKKPHEKLLPIKIRQSVIAHFLKANNDIRLVQVLQDIGEQEVPKNINKADWKNSKPTLASCIPYSNP
ncbi:MAG: hypothetical protein IPJ81_08425 [Chitinophagaceae bacterium]|nr:hypothetical protein [Chitinophagaceae bacterium]